MSDADATLVGNMARDPELTFTAGGSPKCSFGMAVNRKWKDKADEWQEEVSFFNVICWGTLGENVAASLTKGSRIVVKGRLQQRSWETDKGEKRSVVEVVADSVGPDMRWATAEVQKIERDSGNAASAPRAPQAAAPAHIGYDEEPF